MKMDENYKTHNQEKISDDDNLPDNVLTDASEGEEGKFNVSQNISETGSVADDPQSEHSGIDEMTEARNEINELKDKLLRTAAEFENYKKRSNSEKAELLLYANERLIKELLPVLDDFERAIASYREDTNASSLYKGMSLIYEKLLTVLNKQGLKEIESDGKEFNVEYHDAILQQQSDKPANTVLETVEKGYMLRDKVIRHAKVIVSVQANSD